MHRFWVSLLVTALLGQSAFSQNSGQTTTFKISTRTVSLDVVVRDRTGHVVTDLSEGDFEITEDTVPQRVASFEAPSAHSERETAPNQTTSSSSSAVSRTRTILLLDEYNTLFADVAYAKQQMKKYFGSVGMRLPQPTSLYAISQGRLWLIQNYTTDPHEITRALDRHPPILPRAQTSEGFQEELDRFGVCMGVMREIARSQGGLTGRKNLIWLTAGFPEVSADDLRHDSFVRAMQRITNILMDAHVTLYTIDPRGLRTDVAANLTNSAFDPLDGGQAFVELFPSGVFEHDFSLEMLAGQTGGTATSSRNDIGAMIAADSRDGSEYYAITYDPRNHNWDGKYRHIRVTVRKPGLQVSTREGYFALDQPPAPTQKELDLTLKRGMLSPMDYTMLPTRAIWRNAERSRRELKVRVSKRELTLQPCEAGSSYSVQIAIAALAHNGKVLGNNVRTLTGTLPDSALQQVGSVDFDVPVADLPKEAAAVRVAIVDTQSGRLGTSTLTLH